MSENTPPDGDYSLTPDVKELLESPPPWPEVAELFFAQSALAAYKSLGPESSRYAALNQTAQIAHSFLHPEIFNEGQVPVWGAAYTRSSETIRQGVCREGRATEVFFPFTVQTVKGVLDPEGFLNPKDPPRGQLFVLVSTVLPESTREIMENAARFADEANGCSNPSRRNDLKAHLATSLESALSLPRTTIHIESRLTHYGKIHRGINGEESQNGQVVTRLAALNFCARGNYEGLEKAPGVLKEIFKEAKPIGLDPNSRRRSQSLSLWPHYALQATEFWRNTERDYYNEHQLGANQPYWQIFPLNEKQEFGQPENLQKVIDFANSFYGYVTRGINGRGQVKPDSA